ncbi:uncharacterized protein LOC141627806 [Silene latifolia]|uniref:uncharacterized protein LOC141627806 n=1 Tax=Silene latifolia TaxID=37657 RepID=UPI003D76E50C
MWQLCNNALPVKANIAARLRGVDCSCPRCHFEAESCVHVLRDCGWNDDVWEGVGLDVQGMVGGGNVREWVELLIRDMGEKERVMFMTTCWVIWEQRSKMVFDGRGWSCEAIVRRVMDISWEMQCCQEDKAGAARERGVCGRSFGGWVRPGAGVWKINVDAGVKKGLGVGMGAVCRDEQGGVAWAVAVQEEGGRDVAMTEAEALYLGLKEARRLGLRNIIIESDCLIVVTDLQKNKKGRSDICLIYDDIFRISLFFESVVFTYTSRLSNSLAHKVAHAVPWSIGRQFWTDDLPLFFVNIAALDLSNI